MILFTESHRVSIGKLVDSGILNEDTLNAVIEAVHELDTLRNLLASGILLKPHLGCEEPKKFGRYLTKRNSLTAPYCFTEFRNGVWETAFYVLEWYELPEEE